MKRKEIYTKIASDFEDLAKLNENIAKLYEELAEDEPRVERTQVEKPDKTTPVQEVPIEEAPIEEVPIEGVLVEEKPAPKRKSRAKKKAKDEIVFSEDVSTELPGERVLAVVSEPKKDEGGLTDLAVRKRLGVIARGLSGGTHAIVALLKDKYEVTRVSDLPEDKYHDLIRDAEAL